MIEKENRDNIVDYTPDIQAELEEFFKTVLDARGWGFDPEGRHSTLRDIDNAYPREKGGFWIYKIDEIIIGTVAIRPLDKEQTTCELKSMYVLPHYQGKKYGRSLLNYALKQAKEKGYYYIRLDTTKDSVKAINLYKSANFYEIERYNDNNVADVFMELKIR